METKNTHGGYRPGAGRKKGSKNLIQKEKSTVFQFKLSKAQLADLKRRAAAKGLRTATFIKSILFPED